MYIIFNLFLWYFIYNFSRYISYKSKIPFLKDWSSNEDSKSLSFYIVSTIHASFVSSASLYYLYNTNDYNLITDYKDNQIMLIDWSLSYFIADMYYVYLYNDYVFLIHHALGIIYMNVFKNYPLSNLFLISILLPEITTPMLNIWTIGKIKKYNYFNYINTPFTFIYIFIRVFLIILFNIYAFIELYNSDKIPINITIFLFIISLIYCFGNIMWSMKLLNGYKKWIKKKIDLKLS
jgi:hypothetical protein